MSEIVNDQISQKVILSGLLEEFRTALEEEIKSARVDAFGHTVPLISGRQIAHIGKSYQYLFRLKDALNLPGDAPGDLLIPNRQPVNVSIVAVDGMSMIISCQDDLGEFIPDARLVSDLTFLMKKLIERIEDLVGTSNIIGDRLLSNSGVSGELQPVDLDDWKINVSQINALQSSLGRNLTYIWGPPGTGKTQTIGYIGYYLRLNKRSLLIVSHTNAAIDQALMKIADLDKDDLEAGKILRIGIPKDPQIIKEYPNLLLDTHVERRSQEFTSRLSNLRIEFNETQKQLRKLVSDIEFYDWFMVAKKDFYEMSLDHAKFISMEVELDETRKHYSERIKESRHWNDTKFDALKAKNKQIQLEQLESQIKDLSAGINTFSRNKNQLFTSIRTAQDLLKETQSVNWIVRMWRNLPSSENQLLQVSELQAKYDKLSSESVETENELRLILTAKEEATQILGEFYSKYSEHPDELIRQEQDFQQSLNQIYLHGLSLRKEYDEYRYRLTRHYADKLVVIKELGFGEEVSGSVHELYRAINKSFQLIDNRIDSIDIDKCRSQLKTALERVYQIEIEISTIEDSLSRIEELIISEADIIATTLTKAYLSDATRSRHYDTIIVDEASMAPIPSIWVAASLIDKNAVIVGDPKQLPPIVTSKNEIAQKWLGRDIFKVACIEETKPINLVELNEQFRMHPEIAAIPNHFFYKGTWKNSYNGNEKVTDFNKWYNTEWIHDAPVLLIDTGPLNAWVTSVPRGNQSSRLNILSATLCIDLCKILLIKDRTKPEMGNNNRRIIVQCPYQPHAKFLGVLAEENDLSSDIEVGTVHTFQGSEADVVIFDLVNDEPHWRVGLFMAGNDNNSTKLINVAITRAKHRLFIVGDFSYIQAQSKKAFLGAQFIPFLTEHYPIINALNVIPPGLLMRAAEAKILISKGDVENDATDIIVTQDDFYPLLYDDIKSARYRIVIYAAYMTRNRFADLQPFLLSATEKLIRVFVVTKTIEERGKRTEQQEYRYLEQTLEDWGITVIHKRGMHEKLVFIDNEIVWMGSLNPLSYSNSGEIMERRVSKKLFEEYAKVLQMDRLVGEFLEHSPRCPICNSEMIASEGRNEPYYWRCVVDDCYTRSIDQPPLQGGMIVCATCGGDVDYGMWGDKPAWRCNENKHHHQRIIRNHFKFPKMKNKIPVDQIIVLEKFLGIQIIENEVQLHSH